MSLAPPRARPFAQGGGDTGEDEVRGPDNWARVVPIGGAEGSGVRGKGVVGATTVRVVGGDGVDGGVVVVTHVSITARW